MSENERSPRWLGAILLVVVVAIVAAVIAASVMQRPAPPGEAIVNQPLPDNHPPGPCYECHRGMGTGQEIYGNRLPEGHPSERCSQCHEGAGEPTIAKPGIPEPPPAEAFRPAGDALGFRPQ